MPVRANDTLTLASLSCAVLAACAGHDTTEQWALGEARRFLPRPEQVSGDIQREDRPLTIAVPVGVGRDKFAAFARELVSVGAGATIDSAPVIGGGDFALGALGAIHVEEGARVGPIYSVTHGAVRLDDRVIVNGFVKAAGEIARMPSVAVTRGVWEHAGNGVEEFEWQLHPPSEAAGERRSRAGDATASELEPGAYTAVLIEAGSVMRLGAGTYFVDSLRLERGGVLELENAWGPVHIWVRQGFVLDGTVRDQFLGPNVFVGYLGAADLAVNGPLRATLYAPNAQVTLAKTDVEHGGAVFARAVRLEPGARLQHRSFRPLPDVNSPLTLCQACLLELRDVQCCNTRSPLDPADVSSAAACYSTCSSGNPTSDMRCISRCLRPEPGSTQSCAADLVRRLAECQLRSGYRASMCLNLDYIRMEDVSCGG